MILGTIQPNKTECCLCGLKWDGNDAGKDLADHLRESHHRIMIDREDRKLDNNGKPLFSVLQGPRWQNDLVG